MPAEVGILLVHGIGTQIRGETLVSFGEPIFRMLRDWVTFGPPKPEQTSQGFTEYGSAKLINASLSPFILEPSQLSDPPHARFTLKKTDDTVEWLLAECHWANSFPPPAAWTVTLWIMRVLPWICISFIVRRFRMAVGGIISALKGRPTPNLYAASQLTVRALIWFAMFPLIYPVVFVLETACVATLIASLFPFKTIQEVVSRINAILSAMLGDCFIFASSELRQQAIVSKLQKDLAWLKSNCKHCVVVAHSQGAALAYLALQRDDSRSGVRLLATFGSGIVKLLHLGRPEWNVVINLSFVPVGIFFLALWSAFTIGNGLNPWLTNWHLQWVFWGSTVYFVLGALISGGFIGFFEMSHDIRFAASRFANDGMKWVDFFASLDPVPNGPLLHAKSEHLESVELSNRMSPIGDHTSYMDNGDEFLPLIVDAIFRFSGTELRPGEFTDADRSRVSSVRWTRVAAETVDQMLLLFALFALLPHGGAYQFAGTSFTDLIDGMCHGVRVEKCWTFSPERTGLGVMISAYIVCRMFVQLAHWLGAVTSRRSDIFRRLAYLAPFASHLISSLAALLVGSLFYSGTFSWIKWLHDNVPQPISYPSAQTLQAIIFACASALGLTIYGHLRVRALEGKP